MISVKSQVACCLAVGLACVLPQRGGHCQAQAAVDAKPASSIRDEAGMFSADARREATDMLERIEKETGVPSLIETVDSLEGEPLQTVAEWHARWWGKHGLYVLIAKKEQKFQILRHSSLDSVVKDAGMETIRDGFLARLNEQEPDKRLVAGVNAIGVVLRASAPGASATATVVATNDGTLVTRNHVRLNLAGARVVHAAAEAKAGAMGLKVNIAVVDDGGHLLTFTRMDGARPASAATAITKATTAATFRQATGPLPPGSASPDVLLNLSLQNAAAASGGKLTTLHGGVPIVVEGQVIGAVGVGGGTGEQDAEVARAGVNALTEALKAPAKEREH